MRRGRVDAFQVVVEGELGQGLPRRGEGVDLDRVHPARTQRTGPVVAHRTGRYQRDSLHATKAQFTPVLLVMTHNNQSISCLSCS